MKKVAIISLVAMMAVGFGFDLKANGTLVEGLNLSTAGQTFGPGSKNRINLTGTISDATSITIQQDINTFGAANLMFVDTKTSIGTLRLGKQILGLSSWYGGSYQSTKFYTQAGGAAGVNAITLMTEVSGMPAGVSFCGGTNSASKLVAGKLGLSVANNPVTVGLFYSDNNAGKSGFAIGAESKFVVGPVAAYAQGLIDLSDDAAVALAGVAKTRTLAAAGASMAISGTPFQVFGDVTMPLSDGAKLAIEDDPEYKLGAAMPLNADAKLLLEYVSQGSTNSTALNFEIKI